MRQAITILLLLAVPLSAQEAKSPAPTFNKGTEFHIDYTPQPTILIGGSAIIVINDADKKMMVNVTREGVVTYGEGYKPDDAAKAFWQGLAKYYPVVCEKPKAEEKK